MHAKVRGTAQAKHARVARPCPVAAFAAAGLLVMTTIGLTLGVTLRWRGSSWWQTAKFLASTVTWVQWLGLIVWASLTGALIAAGTSHRAPGLLIALSALIAGAVVPIGLLLFAGALNHVWPGTTGPLDRPLLTLLLLAYSLITPWSLGRAIARLPWVSVPR
jgi:hypothetical protein